nr:hypothetical protein [Tanacetum cinerariifolium]
EEVDLSYMLFPMWSSVGFTNPQNNAEDAAFDGKEHDFDVQKPESKVILSPSNKFQDCSENSSNEVPTASTTVPTVGKNTINSTNTFSVAGLSNTAIIYSDDEDVVGAEADFNNLEPTIPVTPIPTTSIHKDHPISQIIGDLSLTTQTRSMTRAVKDQGGLSQMFGNDFHTCMFASFLSLEEPKREEGIDYEEVFTPVARIEAIRLFLAYASFMGFMVYQMDVKSAFLYGTIEEEVYVCQPPGFEDPDHPDKVYKVVKAFYGLHQAPRAWYETLATYLLKNGFQRGTIDQTLFIKKQKGHILLVQIYVDDIIFGATNKDLCRSFEKFMKHKFQMSSMGNSHSSWGFSTPIDTEKPLLKDLDVCACARYRVNPKVSHLHAVKRIFRPNIMFAVCACARYHVNLKVSHLHAVKRIFRYLEGQPKFSLWYPKDSPFDLVAYTDSDYAGASLDRKSTIGVGKKVIITESSIRRDLQLEDDEGIDCLPNVVIFEQLTLMGNMASAVICLATNQKFNFSKYSFKSMVKNLDNVIFLCIQDEDVNEEIDDRLERAATTTSSLDAEKDKGVKSFEDEGLGEEDSSKHGRIVDIDANKDIYLVNVYNDKNMFDVDQDLGGEEVFVAQQDEKVVEKEVDAAQIQVTIAATTPSISTDEPEESTTTITTTIPKSKSQGKGKAKMIEEPMKLKKKDQIQLDEEVALKLQAKFDKEQRLTGERAQKEVEANIALIGSWDEVQAKIDADYQLEERLQAEKQQELNDEEKATLFMQLLEKRRKTELVEESSKKAEAKVMVQESLKRAGTEQEQESSKKQKINDEKDTTKLKQLVKIIPDEEGVTTNAIPLAVKPPSIVDWKIQKEGKKSYYKITRTDGILKIYLIFRHMLKYFDRENVETLWKLVKAKYGSTRTEGAMKECYGVI